MAITVDKTERLIFFDPRWPVLYLDNHLLAVYKPSGLLVQGDRTGDVCLQDLGKQWLSLRYHKPGNVFLAMVHRLDRPVAGVVLFARTSKAASRLSRQFRERTVEKQYLAVVHGKVRKSSGKLTDHIERIHRASRIVPKPTDVSQEARLRYDVLEQNKNQSLLQIVLETGRRHQIRAQLANMGHPILGDLRYGAQRHFPDRQIALLSYLLKVDHPTRDKRLMLTCPIPQGWPSWQNIEASDCPRPPWSFITLKSYSMWGIQQKL